MKTTAYYISVTTETPVERAEYTPHATQLIDGLRDVLTTRLADFTKPPIETATAEVEVAADGAMPAAVVASCVLQATAPKAWAIDKTKLTELVRATLDFPVKITKRAVSKADLHSSGVSVADQ